MFGFALKFRGVGRGVARCILAALAGQLVPAQGKASHAIDRRLRPAPRTASSVPRAEKVPGLSVEL